MIKDDSIQRGKWPLGRVITTYPDPQGIVQRVLIHTPKGDYVWDIILSFVCWKVTLVIKFSSNICLYKKGSSLLGGGVSLGQRLY